MSKFFLTLWGQFEGFFKNLGPNKRISIGAAISVVLIAIASLVYISSGSGYQPLLSNVPTDQMPMLIQKLNAMSVPFELRNNGTAIAVPANLVSAAQMNLMAEVGSSKMGNVGLEVFEKQDFGVNSFAQKVNYQRALQGELMRAINSLTAVKHSKVILAIPNKQNFLVETEKPTASVVLEVHAGKQLTQEQIKGIQYLVANAVQGLDAEKVSVLDERGKLLNRQTDGTTGGSSDLMELKAKVESDLEDRIEKIIAKAVGTGKVIAQVDAQLNNKVVQAVEESVNPDQTAIKSQATDEESLDGSRTNPTGAAGSRANVPGAEDNQGQVGFRQNVVKSNTTTSFEVPKTVRNIRESAGAVEKISIAVLVDGFETKTTKEDGTVETTWNPRSPEDLKKYEDLVKSAIGFNPARGDSVRIENIKFIQEDFSDSERLLTSLERKKLFSDLFKWSLVALALALVFFVIVRPFMQWVTDSFQETVEDMLPRTIEELEELQSIDNSLPGMGSALPILQDDFDPEKAESELLKDRIMAIMGTHEEKAQVAFGMWMVRKE